MANGVLLIEDEATLAKNVKRYLERGDYDVRIAGSGEAGIDAFESFQPDVVLLDYQLPGADGLEVLRRIRELDGRAKIIMITAHGNVQLAVDAMKAGAYDYLNKPVVLSELRLLIDNAVGQEHLEGTLDYYQSKDASRGGLDALLGDSPAMENLRGQIRRLLESERRLGRAAAPAVLILGETGTGKELIARALHFDGPRAQNPFVELNCAGIPAALVESELFGYERGAFTDAKSRKPGLVEAASGGTVFLDEVGELELPVQAKLLKLLENQTVRRLGSVRDKQVNVRIIGATNRDLEARINASEFRSDLYFRLRIVTLTAPPLRDRGDDTLILAKYFLNQCSRRYGRPELKLSPAGKQALFDYRWPGNVRELRNVIEHAALLAPEDIVGPDALAFSPTLAGASAGAHVDSDVLVQLPPGGVRLEDLERSLVTQALERESGNVSRAARLLGLSRDTLRYRIEKFGIKVS